MLKIRVQGETRYINRFMRILKRNQLLEIENESGILPNRNSKRYKRYCFEIHLNTPTDRKRKTLEANKKKEPPVKAIYHGTGVSFVCPSADK